jgi:electron transport complex protein RnfB
MSDAYKRLAIRLDELPHGYPATEGGVEIKILKKIFSQEDAEMALKMRPIPETAGAIAQRLGKPLPETRCVHQYMCDRINQAGTPA